MTHIDPYEINQEEIPDDVNYNWARVFCFKDKIDEAPDFNNIIRKMREGWTFVPITRHPGKKRDERIPEALMNDMVCGGHVLMEKPK